MTGPFEGAGRFLGDDFLEAAIGDLEITRPRFGELKIQTQGGGFWARGEREKLSEEGAKGG